MGTAQQKWLVATEMMELILVLSGKAHAIMHFAFSGIPLPEKGASVVAPMVRQMVYTSVSEVAAALT